jgi:hypothetical protein
VHFSLDFDGKIGYYHCLADPLASLPQAAMPVRLTKEAASYAIVFHSPQTPQFHTDKLSFFTEIYQS